MAVRFDKTVTLGNLIVAASIAAAILFSWARMDFRIYTVEITLKEQQQIVANQADTVRLLSLNVQKLTTLADIYVPRIEELSREKKGRP